jgi:two-component system, chemotaxis family, chemotaxis protein CheY
MLSKILVVDDSALIQQMYKMTLLRYNCTIIAAKNGQAALDLLPQHPDIGLILLDINMPIMGGLEFLQKVKALGSYSHIPIIIQSTEGKDDDTKRGMELGAAGYITKPIQPAALHSLIEKLVQPTNGKGN